MSNPLISKTISSKSKFWIIAIIVGLIGTIIYMLPVLGTIRHGAGPVPGFILSGDVRMLWFPQFIHGYERFWSGGIFGFDFLTAGGASLFAQRTNLLPIYPPYIISYLLFDISNVKTALVVFSTIYAFHVWVGISFTILIARNFFGFKLGAAILAGGVYVLSFQATVYQAYTPFFFHMMLVPALIYVFCKLFFARSWLPVLLASAFIANYMLTSYGPLMAGGFAIAVLFALFFFYMNFWNRFSLKFCINRLLIPTYASLIASLVCLPYYISQAIFFLKSGGSGIDLHSVAHHLALQPSDLISALSPAFSNATVTEGRLHWGLIQFTIVALGVVLMAYISPTVQSRFQRYIKLSLVLYVIMMCITFGVHTIASDIFYYLVPVLGTMHIYQRFMMFAQLPLAFAVAGCATIFITYAAQYTRAAVAGGTLLLWVIITFWLATSPDAATLGASQRLIFEVFLAAFCIVVLTFTYNSIALSWLAVPIAITSLVFAYDIQRTSGKNNGVENMMLFTSVEKDRVGALIKLADKKLPKVLNLSSEIDSYLPYNLSWLSPGGTKYMNYYGYEPHLATERDYLKMMGGFYGRFNIEWIHQSGTDFIVWDEGSATQKRLFDNEYFALGETHPLGGGLQLTKLIYKIPANSSNVISLIDLPERDPSAWKISTADGWELDNGVMRKTETGTLHHFAIQTSPSIGTTYGVSFDMRGSTKGTIRVSLGSNSSAELVQGSLPGRKTVQVDTLNIGDLWFSSSADFDGSITNVQVTQIITNGTPEFKTVANNGFVRLETLEGQPAQLLNFNTNWSTFVHSEVSSQHPSRLVYLLWPVSAMVPFIDGQEVELIKRPGLPAYVDVPAGDHIVEFRYKNIWVIILKGLAAIYIVVLIGAICYCYRNRRKNTV